MPAIFGTAAMHCISAKQQGNSCYVIKQVIFCHFDMVMGGMMAFYLHGKDDDVEEITYYS